MTDASSWRDYFFFAAFFAGFFAAFFVAMRTPPPFNFKNCDRLCVWYSRVCDASKIFSAQFVLFDGIQGAT